MHILIFCPLFFLFKFFGSDYRAHGAQKARFSGVFFGGLSVLSAWSVSQASGFVERVCSQQTRLIAAGVPSFAMNLIGPAFFFRRSVFECHSNTINWILRGRNNDGTLVHLFDFSALGSLLSRRYQHRCRSRYAIPNAWGVIGTLCMLDRELLHGIQLRKHSRRCVARCESDVETSRHHQWRWIYS
jgi:hypothetical protein